MAERMGAGDKAPHDRSLLELARNRGAAIVAWSSATRISAMTMRLPLNSRAISRISSRFASTAFFGRYATPVGQHVHGNEIYRRHQPLGGEGAFPLGSCKFGRRRRIASGTDLSALLGFGLIRVPHHRDPEARCNFAGRYRHPHRQPRA